MIIPWLRSHFSYLVLACLSSLCCLVFGLVATWSGLLEMYSVQMLVASALAITYALPIFLPALSRLAWTRPRSPAKWLVPVVWWSLPVTVIVFYAVYDHMWRAVFAENMMTERRHQELKRFSSLNATIFGEEGGRMVYWMYAFSGHEPLKPPEAEWTWRKFLDATLRPFKRDDDRARFALMKVANACEQQRKFHQSEEQFRQLLAVLEMWSEENLARLPYSNRASIMSDKRLALRGISTSLVQQGEYAQAASFLERALEISKQYKYKHEVMIDSAELADLYIRLENYKAAEPLAATALKLSGESASLGLKASSGYVRAETLETYAAACLRLSKVLHATGRPELAAKYGRMVNIFRDNAYPSPDR